MAIEESLYTRLTTHSGTAALVSTRVYPVRLPQSPTLPAVTYQRITGGTPAHVIFGAAKLDTSIYQVTAWASSYSGVKALAAAVRSALDGYDGTTWNSLVVGLFDNDIELDTGYYSVILQAQVTEHLS